MIPKWERRIKREKRHAVEKAIFYTFGKKKSNNSSNKKVHMTICERMVFTRHILDKIRGDIILIF